MILTQEIIDYSNGCVPAPVMAQANEAGLFVGQSDIDAVEAWLRANNQVLIANWLKVAKSRWFAHTQEVIAIMYHVFNPLTGVHEDQATKDLALARRDEIKQEFMAANASLFTILVETKTAEGSHTDTLVD